MLIRMLKQPIVLLIGVLLLTACGKSASSLTIQTGAQSTALTLTASSSAVREALSAIISTGGSPSVTDLQIALTNGVLVFSGNSHQGSAVNPFHGTLVLGVQNHWLTANVTALTVGSWIAQLGDLQKINRSIADGLNSVATQNQGSLQFQSVQLTTDQLVIQMQTPATSSGSALFGLAMDAHYYHLSITVTQENVLSWIVSANNNSPKPFILDPGLGFQNGQINFAGRLPSSPTTTYPISLSVRPGVLNGNLTLAITAASAFGYALPADSLAQINAGLAKGMVQPKSGDIESIDVANGLLTVRFRVAR